MPPWLPWLVGPVGITTVAALALYMLREAWMLTVARERECREQAERYNQELRVLLENLTRLLEKELRA